MTRDVTGFAAGVTGVAAGDTSAVVVGDTRAVIVGRDGRAKAYRPLPVAERSAAIAAGLAAYERGDFFLAHEDLEPAWMGSSDVA